jgi:esterase/lipase
MRWLRISLLAVGLCIPLAGLAAAQSRVGVVLLHGKQGSPQNLQSLAEALQAAGYPVERPEMCWSRQRIYDRSYIECLDDIDAAAERLRAAGASEIVVVGMSLGGNAALAYGARRERLLGIVALAPAPAVEFLTRRSDIAESVAKASQMVAQGLGGTYAVFKDVNTAEPFDVTTTASIYLSFVAPDSPGLMPDNAAKLKVPLLVVSGQFDFTQRSVGYVFARAPSHPLNWHLMLNANHRGTPAAARGAVVSWLRLLGEAAPRN